MAHLHLGVFQGNFLHYFAPQSAAFKNVGLIDGHQFFAARHGGIKRLAGNALHLVAAINHGVVGRIAIVDALTFAKINIARQFPKKQNIGTFQNLRFDARRAQQLIEKFDGAQVGIQAQFFAHPQQALLGAHFGVGVVVVFGMPHRAEQYGIGGAHFGEGFVGEGVSRGFDGRVAHQCVVKYKLMFKAQGNFFQYFFANGSDLLANAVARNNKNIFFHSFGFSDGYALS